MSDSDEVGVVPLQGNGAAMHNFDLFEHSSWNRQVRVQRDALAGAVQLSVSSSGSAAWSFLMAATPHGLYEDENRKRGSRPPAARAAPMHGG